MKNLLNFTAIYQLNKTKATSDLVECLTVLDILDIDIRLTFLSPDKTPEEFHEMMIAYKQCADRLLDCVESAIKGGEITRLQGSEIIMENMKKVNDLQNFVKSLEEVHKDMNDLSADDDLKEYQRTVYGMGI